MAETTFRRLQTCAVARGAHPPTSLPGLTITYDDFYQNLRNWGYNVIRLPDPVAQPRADRADLGRPGRPVRAQLEPELPQRPAVDDHEGPRRRNHGDPRHAAGLLVARSAQHHQLGRQSGLLRGLRHAEVDVPIDRRQAGNHAEHRLLQRHELVLPQHPRPDGDRDPGHPLGPVRRRVADALLRVLGGFGLSRLPGGRGRRPLQRTVVELRGWQPPRRSNRGPGGGVAAARLLHHARPVDHGQQPELAAVLPGHRRRVLQSQTRVFASRHG